MLVNYILCVRCKTICYSSAAGMEHVGAIAEQISQERLLCVLFLCCGLVRFKPPLCSGINWKAAAELQLGFCAFWGPSHSSSAVCLSLSCGFSQHGTGWKIFLYPRACVELALAHRHKREILGVHVMFWKMMVMTYCGSQLFVLASGAVITHWYKKSLTSLPCRLSLL